MKERLIEIMDTEYDFQYPELNPQQIQEYQEPMEEYQAPQEPAPNPFENEFRTVSTRPQQPQRSDGDLFADAADARSKKLRY